MHKQSATIWQRGVLPAAQLPLVQAFLASHHQQHEQRVIIAPHGPTR